jgi:hypothetical protein
MKRVYLVGWAPIEATDKERNERLIDSADWCLVAPSGMMFPHGTRVPGPNDEQYEVRAQFGRILHVEPAIDV